MPTFPAIMGCEWEIPFLYAPGNDFLSSANEILQSEDDEDDTPSGIVACIQSVMEEVCRKYDAVPFDPYDLYSSGSYCRLGRAYRDGGLIEISSLRYNDPYTLAKYIGVMHCAVGAAVRAVAERNGHEIHAAYAAVSDRHNTSSGVHANYLLNRKTFTPLFAPQKTKTTHTLDPAACNLISALICFKLLTGAGKKGREYLCRRRNNIRSFRSSPFFYQIDERADFIEYAVSRHSTNQRGIIHTRDEPHADSNLFARTHIINQNGNIAPVSTILAYGLPAVLLMAFEDKAFSLDWEFPNPVRALRIISRDIFFERVIRVWNRQDGRLEPKKPLDLLEDILQKLLRYCSDVSGIIPSWCEEVVRQALDIFGYLKREGPLGEASRKIDWCIKLALLSGKIRSCGLNPWDISSWQNEPLSSKLLNLDLEYHRLDKRNVLAILVNRGRIELGEKYIQLDPAVLLPDSPIWKEIYPNQTLDHLFLFCTQHPLLKKYFQVYNWDNLFFQDGDFAASLVFGDPRRFGRDELDALMAGNSDFSSFEKRLNFVRMLSAACHKN